MNSFSSGLKGEDQNRIESTARYRKVALLDLGKGLRECGNTLIRTYSYPVLILSAAGTVGGKSAVTPLTGLPCELNLTFPFLVSYIQLKL